jgi:molybdopterin molybdotransferase
MSCCDAGAMSVQEALNTMLAQITPVSECVTVSLANSQGHILAEDVLSPLNMPPFDNSAMDGYAFRFLHLARRYKGDMCAHHYLQRLEHRLLFHLVLESLW